MSNGEYRYQANASAGSMILGRPERARTGPLVLSNLPDTGGSVSSMLAGFSYQGIARFGGSRTLVIGCQDPRHGVYHTSAVASIEKLNILEFLTADRLTASLSVANDVVRRRLYVSLGGMHFENLVIGGDHVSLEQPADETSAPFPPFSYPHVDQRSFGRIRFALMKRGETSGSYSLDLLRVELGADSLNDDASEPDDWGIYVGAAQGILTFCSVSVSVVVPAGEEVSEKVGTRIPPGHIPLKKSL